MRILLLSCNTGGGHNSAAAAIKEYFDSVNIYCEIKDALAFDSRLKSEFISRGHVFIYKKAPSLFGAGYHYAEKHPSKPGNESVIYTIMKNGTDSLYEFLRSNHFDAVISTHIFASMMLTELRAKYDFYIRSYFVATDYTCSPGVDELDADAFFIPHKYLIPEFTNNGIPEGKIVASGIPVKRAFYHSVSADKAKQMLGLPSDKRIVLLMCGSMGCGPIEKLGAFLVKTMPQNTMLVVVCGNNKKLYHKFQKLGSEERICVIGYTNKINLYMDAASVIITKPGGLSVTESATKALPMVLMNVVAGCETRNLDFFMKKGFAVSADTVHGLTEEVNALLSDEKKAKDISEALGESFSSYAAESIGTFVLSDISKGDS